MKKNEGETSIDVHNVIFIKENYPQRIHHSVAPAFMIFILLLAVEAKNTYQKLKATSTT